MLRDAMRSHAACLKLQEDIIWALLNIVWSDEACRDAVRNAGVVPYVIEARIRHKHSGSAVLDHKARDLLEKIDPAGAAGNFDTGLITMGQAVPPSADQMATFGAPQKAF